MGCDIHLHTEIKLNGKWQHMSAPHIRRDYRWFSHMAGVRNNDDITPISEPKGLPSDASEVTKFDADRWDGDGHNHSYLTADEIVEMENRIKDMDDHFPERQWGYLFGNSWGGFKEYPEDVPEGIEDVRFVFWFDN